MRRNLAFVITGFVLAVLAAALVGLLFKFPLAGALDGSIGPLKQILRGTLSMLPVALPLGIAAIWAGESQRWRHWYYWAGISALIGLCGFLALTANGSLLRSSFLSAKGVFGLMAMGLAGGHVYWWLAGHRAGLLSAVVNHNLFKGGAEADARRRCWLCNILGLLLGLLPLAFLGWSYFHKGTLPSAIVAKAEVDAAERLKNAGLKDVKFKITDHTGHVMGAAPDAAAKAKAFEMAKLALAPYVGIPGVVGALQNDIEAPLPPDPAIAAVTEAKRKAEEELLTKKANEARVAAEAELKKKAETEVAAAKKKAEKARLAEESEAKKKAEEEAAMKKAEDSRLAAEAEVKKKAEEEAIAKKKAEDEILAKKKSEDARVAAEAEAKKTTEEEAAAKQKAEEARLAIDAEAKKRAEDSRIAAEAEAKKKAEEDASSKKRAEEVRLAAEVELKKKSEDDAAAKKKVEEARLAAEAEAKKKAEEARLAVEAELKIKAEEEAATKKKAEDEAAKKKAAEAATAKTAKPAKTPESVKTPAVPAATAISSQAQCASDFTTLFLSDKIRFSLNSADLSSDISSYLDKIAALAKSCDTFQITIDGHTDRTGDEVINDELADDRAENVRAALVERGVPSARLATHGFGDERPLEPGNNWEAFRLNRRVDLGFREQSTNKN